MEQSFAFVIKYAYNNPSSSQMQFCGQKGKGLRQAKERIPSEKIWIYFFIIFQRIIFWETAVFSANLKKRNLAQNDS